MTIHQNIYFTGKKVAIDGCTLYPIDGLKTAVAKMGGTLVTDLNQAELIVYGKNSVLAASRDPYRDYPNAISSWEGKVDDLLQELPNGIEDLF